MYMMYQCLIEDDINQVYFTYYEILNITMILCNNTSIVIIHILNI